MRGSSDDFAIVFDIVLGLAGLVLGAVLLWMLVGLITTSANAMAATLTASLMIALALSGLLLRSALKRWSSRQRPPARYQHSR